MKIKQKKLKMPTYYKNIVKTIYFIKTNGNAKHIKKKKKIIIIVFDIDNFFVSLAR